MYAACEPGRVRGRDTPPFSFSPFSLSRFRSSSLPAINSNHQPPPFARHWGKPALRFVNGSAPVPGPFSSGRTVVGLGGSTDGQPRAAPSDGHKGRSTCVHIVRVGVHSANVTPSRSPPNNNKPKSQKPRNDGIHLFTSPKGDGYNFSFLSHVARQSDSPSFASPVQQLKHHFGPICHMLHRAIHHPRTRRVIWCGYSTLPMLIGCCVCVHDAI